MGYPAPACQTRGKRCCSDYPSEALGELGVHRSPSPKLVVAPLDSRPTCAEHGQVAVGAVQLPQNLLRCCVAQVALAAMNKNYRYVPNLWWILGANAHCR